MNYIDEYSEGEIFIAEYLNERRIKYHFQKKIENLKEDDKSFRVADFYLPKYKIYIEFFGLWNATEENRQNYKKKKEIYKKNNIPCIYLYPENLGIINHLLDFRIQRELENKKLNKELYKFRFNLFIEDRGFLFLWFALSVLFLIFADYNVNPENNLLFIFSLSGIAIWQIYRFYRGYKMFFKNDYSLKPPSYKDPAAKQNI